MSANYEAEWRARFDKEAELPEDLPDIQWLRQVLMRRTHRRYSERPVPDALIRLLLGTASSASSKSDFQQASVIWVKDRGRRDRVAALVPDMPWIGNAPVFLVFCGDARRLERIGELRGHPQHDGNSKGFSTPRSTQRWSCRALSWGLKPRVSAVARSVSSATTPMWLPRPWGCRLRCSLWPGCASAILRFLAISACGCRLR